MPPFQDAPAPPGEGASPVSAPGTGGAAGIYVHLPFCRRKCPYCDFYSVTGDEARRRRFLAALARESRLRADPGLAPDTLYFGGGTPSLFGAEQIAALVARVATDFGLAAGAEITLEANPGTLGRGALEGYRRAGVNRINLGVQSLDDRHLAFLGRLHDAARARRAVALARGAGFEDIGLDLIYGLPGQDPAAWRAELAAALALEPTHLSCYMLTYAPGTALTARRDRGAFHPLDDRRIAVLFEITAETLTRAGFLHYEIANFARDGRPPRWSRHNRKYWNAVPYVGLGPSAHSFDGRRRSWNAADLDGYLEALAAGRRPPGEEEVLTREERMSEVLLLGLRQTAGLDLALFESRFAVDFGRLFGPLPAQLTEAGLARLEAGHLRLTRRGLLVADAVALHLARCF